MSNDLETNSSSTQRTSSQQEQDISSLTRSQLLSTTSSSLYSDRVSDQEIKMTPNKKTNSCACNNDERDTLLEQYYLPHRSNKTHKLSGNKRCQTMPFLTNLKKPFSSVQSLSLFQLESINKSRVENSSFLINVIDDEEVLPLTSSFSSSSSSISSLVSSVYSSNHFENKKSKSKSKFESLVNNLKKLNKTCDVDANDCEMNEISDEKHRLFLSNLYQLIQNYLILNVKQTKTSQNEKSGLNRCSEDICEEFKKMSKPLMVCNF
jgi:hypothetical protein